MIDKNNISIKAHDPLTESVHDAKTARLHDK